MNSDLHNARPSGAVSAGGDFTTLLRAHGLLQDTAALSGAASRGALPEPTVATTVLAFEYKDGILMAGDRRATAGNTVVYDRADKVIEIDPHTVLAIAGTPATAFEMARVLKHSFQFFRRSQLQPLSLDARVRALGRLLRENLPLTLQGVGVVVPLLAVTDAAGESKPQLYFYDALGAQFLAADFAVSGSGSPAVRGVLHYVNRWTGRTIREMNEKDAVRLALQLLDVAAEFDTATGGIDRRADIFPIVKLLRKEGLSSVEDAALREALGGPLS